MSDKFSKIAAEYCGPKKAQKEYDEEEKEFYSGRKACTTEHEFDGIGSQDQTRVNHFFNILNNHGNEALIAAAIKQICSNDGLYEDMVGYARESAIDKFTRTFEACPSIHEEGIEWIQRLLQIPARELSAMRAAIEHLKDANVELSKEEIQTAVDLGRASHVLAK